MTVDANPCRIVGAGRAKRVHRIRPASVEELSVLTNAMPERLQLMITLASWCALRFGETVELRRGGPVVDHSVPQVGGLAMNLVSENHGQHRIVDRAVRGGVPGAIGTLSACG